jgi:hypothetical protein
MLLGLYLFLSPFSLPYRLKLLYPPSPDESGYGGHSLPYFLKLCMCQ